jgi:hypothetical protein
MARHIPRRTESAASSPESRLQGVLIYRHLSILFESGKREIRK